MSQTERHFSKIKRDFRYISSNFQRYKYKDTTYY